MKASLAQRRDYQVKCDKSIQFGATKRESEDEDDDGGIGDGESN